MFSSRLNSILKPRKTRKKNQPNSCHDIEIHAFKLVGNYYTFDVCTLERNGVI